MKLKSLKYNQEVFNISHICVENYKSEWICKNFHNLLSSKNP